MRPRGRSWWTARGFGAGPRGRIPKTTNAFSFFRIADEILYLELLLRCWGTSVKNLFFSICVERGDVNENNVTFFRGFFLGFFLDRSSAASSRRSERPQQRSTNDHVDVCWIFLLGGQSRVDLLGDVVCGNLL
jgi:hypothetical protein